jgi:hypothetical protein
MWSRPAASLAALANCGKPSHARSKLADFCLSVFSRDQEKELFMNKDATLKETEAASSSVPPITVSDDGSGKLTATPTQINVTKGDLVTWQSSQEFEVQFLNKSPFPKGKLCAQLGDDGMYKASDTVTLDSYPDLNYPCPYKLKSHCSGFENESHHHHDHDDAAIDPIIIVDCASCGDDDDDDDDKRGCGDKK